MRWQENRPETALLAAVAEAARPAGQPAPRRASAASRRTLVGGAFDMRRPRARRVALRHVLGGGTVASARRARCATAPSRPRDRSAQPGLAGRPRGRRRARASSRARRHRLDATAPRLSALAGRSARTSASPGRRRAALRGACCRRPRDAPWSARCWRCACGAGWGSDGAAGGRDVRARREPGVGPAAARAPAHARRRAGRERRWAARSSSSTRSGGSGSFHRASWDFGAVAFSDTALGGSPGGRQHDTNGCRMSGSGYAFRSWPARRCASITPGASSTGAGRSSSD